MKKVSNYILIIFLLFLLTGCSDDKENADKNTNPDASKLSTTVENSMTNTTPLQNEQNEIRMGANENTEPEEEIASFSTKLGGKDTPRSHNISLTTSTLNETIVKNR